MGRKRARRWLMRELDRLSDERHRNQSGKPCPTLSKSAMARGHRAYGTG